MARFDHDCDRCEYLGMLDELDWWFCRRDKTLIARRGNQDWEYMSLPLHTAYQLQGQDPDFSMFRETDLERLREVFSRWENVWLLSYLGRWIECSDEVRALVIEYLKHPLSNTFMSSILHLTRIAQNRKGVVRLYKDFAPLSLGWSIARKDGSCDFSGGLIFHGGGGYDAGAPVFSVTLDPRAGWQVHS